MYNCHASELDIRPNRPWLNGRTEKIHMPKKAHGRQAKQRSRTRRPVTTSSSTQPVGSDDVAVAPATVAPSAAVPASTRTSPRTSSTPRPGAARRAPAITVNYAYLNHDLMTLGILSPAMVVLLIIAFLVFHGA